MKEAKETREMKEYNPKIAEYKKKTVGDMIELIKRYNVVGIVDMENLPTPQLQKLREKFRDTVKIVMTKKRIIKIALENVKSEKKGIEALAHHLEGMPAFVFTQQNPFKVSSMFQKNKSPAPAKPNQIAPIDIVVQAGPTPFAPGPIISDLGMIGLKTGVEGGKVVVKNDSIVARKGEKIRPKVADVLTRLNIYPMEVGLELVAVYDKGTVYGKDILSVTQEEYITRIVKASHEANALALEVSYMTKETINQLIIKAFVSAKALAQSQKIPTEKLEEKEEFEEEKRIEEKEKEIKEEPKEEKEELKEEVKEKEERIEIKELKEEPKVTKIKEPKLKKEIKEPKPVEEKEEIKEKPEEKPKKPEPKKEKILKKPRMVADAVSQEKAEELLEQLQKSGTFRKRVETRLESKEVEDVDLSKEKIEELAKELRKKGTLRKKGGK